MVKDFFNFDADVLPILEGVHRIIGLLLKSHGLPPQRSCFSPDAFDDGYHELISTNREFGGEVYDAVKQIPAYTRLASSASFENAFQQIRDTPLAGLAWGGYGIRIDNPGESRYQAAWHQEYPAQFRSLDGVTFWSPLRTVTPDLGPVHFCLGSHNDGLVRVHTRDANNPGKSGAYGLVLENESSLVERYPQVAPLTTPSDVVLIDFLTIHRSGTNISTHSRWSSQVRYFNFTDPQGVRIAWKGSFAAGNDLSIVHPELIAG